MKIVEHQDGSILELGGIDEYETSGAGWRVGCALGCWTPLLAAGIALATDFYHASITFFILWGILTWIGTKLGKNITAADEHCVRLRIDRGRGELTWWEARGRRAKKESVSLESIHSIQMMPGDYDGPRRVLPMFMVTDDTEKPRDHDLTMEFDFLDDERAVELAVAMARVLQFDPPLVTSDPDALDRSDDDEEEDRGSGLLIAIFRERPEESGEPAEPPELDRRPFVTIPDGVGDPPWGKLDGVVERENGLQIDERSRIWIGMGLFFSYFLVRSSMRIVSDEKAGLVHEFILALSSSLLIWGAWTRLTERAPRMVIDRRGESVQVKGSHVAVEIPFTAIDRVVRVTGEERGVILDTSEGSVRVPLDSGEIDDPMAARVAAGLSRWFSAEAQSFSPPADPDEEGEGEEEAEDGDAPDETRD